LNKHSIGFFFGLQAGFGFHEATSGVHAPWDGGGDGEHLAHLSEGFSLAVS